MLTKCTALTIWLLASLASVNPAEMDCSKRLDYNTVSSCCPRPNLNFDAFRPSCGKFMQEGKPKISPCLFECIFNSNNVLDGMELNVPNARKVLQDMLGANKDFLDIYVESMRNCSSNTEALMKRMRRNMGQNNCTKVALFLSWCTAENIFAHCPATSWRSSQSCEEAHDFMVNCKCDDNQSVCIQM
ncbi:uncharacterized protein LOC133844922 [Drosophila sulfurigaster albostrigata]|uniref:uncharacterized protein LOC133844922 n=1 Tax=Drosophila sulfurigaster albostrigata TaxID=89887 RepID=UPI002D21B195|nr:uncharacterized protein LOC133844922 [Drosophila sulfurigaster albostrigata]